MQQNAFLVQSGNVFIYTVASHLFILFYYCNTPFLRDLQVGSLSLNDLRPFISRVSEYAASLNIRFLTKFMLLGLQNNQKLTSKRNNQGVIDLMIRGTV